MSNTQATERKTQYSLLVDFFNPDDELIVQVPMAANGLLLQQERRQEAQELVNDIGRYMRRVGGDYVRWPQVFEIVDKYVELKPTPTSEAPFVKLVQMLDRSEEDYLPYDEGQALTLWHNIREPRPLEDTFRTNGRYPDVLDGSTPPYTSGILYLEFAQKCGKGKYGIVRGAEAVLEQEKRPDLVKHMLVQLQRAHRYRIQEGNPGMTMHEMMMIILQYISISTNPMPDASRPNSQTARQ